MKFKQLQALSSYWNKLTNGSASRKIFGAAVTVGLFTVFVKLAAMAKELVVAWRFGTGDEVDAFLIALEFPALISNVLSNSFAPALIPVYIKVREQQGNKATYKLLSGALTCGLVLLLVTTLLMVTTAPLYLPLVASGFSPEKLRLTFNLMCAIAPFVLLNGFAVIWSALLNARESFAIASFCPILIPTISIFLLLTVKSLGIFALAIGMVGGIILKLIILGFALHRYRIPLLPQWSGFDEHLRQVVTQYFTIVMGAFLICSAGPVDQIMAATLPAGSVASLSYGKRIINASTSLICTALSAAVIPYFSKMIANADWQEIKRTKKQYVKLIFLITIPVTALFIFFALPIIQLLFQKGSFTLEDAKLVAQTQSLYAIHIPFYIGNLLMLRIITSMSKSQILSYVSALNLIINIALNYIFMQWIGVKGIALSTSCVYIISFIMLNLFVNQQLSKYKSI